MQVGMRREGSQECTKNSVVDRMISVKHSSLLSQPLHRIDEYDNASCA